MCKAECEVPSESEEDAETSSGCPPSVPAPSLMDFMCSKPIRNKDRKKNRSGASGISDSSAESEPVLAYEKTMFRQASRNESYIPPKFHSRAVQTVTPAVPRVEESPQYFEMIPTVFRIPEECLFPEVLREDFGSKYFEASCLPRRFCVDISDTVRNVMAVSHGDTLEDYNIHVVVVFQVDLPNLAHFKMLRADNSPWENVK